MCSFQLPPRRSIINDLRVKDSRYSQPPLPSSFLECSLSFFLSPTLAVSFEGWWRVSGTSSFPFWTLSLPAFHLGYQSSGAKDKGWPKVVPSLPFSFFFLFSPRSSPFSPLPVFHLYERFAGDVDDRQTKPRFFPSPFPFFSPLQPFSSRCRIRGGKYVIFNMPFFFFSSFFFPPGPSFSFLLSCACGRMKGLIGGK